MRDGGKKEPPVNEKISDISLSVDFGRILNITAVLNFSILMEKFYSIILLIL